MTGESLAFYGLAFFLVGSSILAVSVRNIFHAAMYLILALFTVAGFFVLLHAEFLAAVQVLIYVGAVAVLIIFAVMLTSRLTDARVRAHNEQVAVGIVVSVALFVTITMALWSTSWPVTEAPQAVDNIRTLGRMLMTRFVLPFEIASVLLLAAMIGAIVIAAKESGSREDQEGQEGA
jgi:NADH:ubiquinone oxidoreductase subunit 6 (subunit J)